MLLNKFINAESFVHFTCRFFSFYVLCWSRFGWSGALKTWTISGSTSVWRLSFLALSRSLGAGFGEHLNFQSLHVLGRLCGTNNVSPSDLPTQRGRRHCIYAAAVYAIQCHRGCGSSTWYRIIRSLWWRVEPFFRWQYSITVRKMFSYFGSILAVVTLKNTYFWLKRTLISIYTVYCILLFVEEY